MLNERRNCFRGLTTGLEPFRICWPTGEAFREEWLEPVNDGRDRGGAKAATGRRGD
jgi:hypothetical protein